MKNWLREDGALARDVASTLGEEGIERRGLFDPAAVRRLLDEHRRWRHNHSHRLWGLYTLELWLRAREAGKQLTTPAPERTGVTEGLQHRANDGAPIRVLIACDSMGYGEDDLHGLGRLMVEWVTRFDPARIRSPPSVCALPVGSAKLFSARGC